MIRLCSEPRCPGQATYRGKCKDHARQRERQTNRAGKRIYNSARWKNTRTKFLFDHPLCKCGEIATDVHHRVDLKDGGDPWDFGNLEALCHACHAAITANRMNKRDRGGSG